MQLGKSGTRREVSPIHGVPGTHLVAQTPAPYYTVVQYARGICHDLQSPKLLALRLPWLPQTDHTG